LTASFFFEGYDYLKNENSEAFPLLKADYLKLFVVTRGFLDSVARSDSSTPVRSAGFNIGEEFYQLINAEDERVLEELTVALLLNTDPGAAAEFTGQWILVTGTGANKLSEAERMLCETLGFHLAKNGYGLICGGWPGTDTAVSRSFSTYLQSMNIPDKQRIIQLLEDGQESAYGYGRIEVTPIGRNWFSEAVNRSFALVMIGGKGGTFIAFEHALKKKMPVFPVPGTGGDAKKAYNDLLKNKNSVSGRQQLADLDRPVQTDADALFITEKILGMLQKEILQGNPEAFRKKVQEIYRDKPIQVPDDLQKGRWGGQPMDKRKLLTATVEKSSIPFFFDVTLRVGSEGSEPLSGQVAFFLHNTFPNEIEYTVASGGIAEYKLSAYEAFTAAAYTEDGTTLELDLNEVSGLPEGFYYTDVPEKFKQTVTVLYQQREITVHDDPQKNRWGGQSAVNGKEIRASVKKALVPRFYNITIEINTINPSGPRGGEVAFFLHDTFLKKIRYSKIINGAAKVTVSAYEAFTVGAYTSDGTMLELDLQQQQGYPSGFYYKQPQQNHQTTGTKA